MSSDNKGAARPASLVRLVRQPRPVRAGWDEVVVLTAHMPWLVRRVLSAADVHRWAEQDVTPCALGEHDALGWHALERSPAFDRKSVQNARWSLTYGMAYQAFVPLFVLSARTLSLRLPTLTRDLDTRYRQRWAQALDGELNLNLQERGSLGSGYDEQFGPDEGVSQLRWMELELSPGAVLLGQGWTWAARRG